MIQQASFQSELFAEATFWCATLVQAFWADYPVKSANLTENSGVMTNPVSLLPVTWSELPVFDPTQPVDMLLGGGYIPSWCQRVGNISSGLSGVPANFQL
ncbi:hypothetical protein PF007_g15658 [Phytophthora fragariae]|uniref:Uncharacterized protein n=1 Tax=Phytophthora fragariae TaxID=53985 RepID=A0A6A3RLY1_9STRA|nr:hypothetical protein PF007_g15658 [Phytophthora fragariae]